MPVETFNYIDSLDPNNPTGFDQVSDGDDHIRGIKSALKNTFPNVKGQVVASEDDLNKLTGVGTTKNLFAAVTYDGYNIVGDAHNVPANGVQWVEQTEAGSTWKFARVSFLTPFTTTTTMQNGTLDANLNIQVTAFSNANNSLGFAGFVFATITEIYPTHVEVAFAQTDHGGSWQVSWNQAFCLMVAAN